LIKIFVHFQRGAKTISNQPGNTAVPQIEKRVSGDIDTSPLSKIRNFLLETTALIMAFDNDYVVAASRVHTEV
jgi:hypothetical protein